MMRLFEGDVYEYFCSKMRRLTPNDCQLRPIRDTSCLVSLALLSPPCPEEL